MTQLYLLYEHAIGYCLFCAKEFEEIGSFLPQVEDAAKDSSKFKKVVKLVGFKPFKNTVVALANMNAISEGLVYEDLSSFLETNLPISNKKSFTLGVSEAKLGASINEALDIQVTHIGAVPEVLRGIRMHIEHFIKGLNASSLKQTELGLGHSYSRSKVKFNVNRVDNMIIQSIALIDQLDKDINTFSMRIREWYSYHFPELAKVVTDNYEYALCANFIKNRSSLSPESFDSLEELLKDSAKAQSILDASRMSMGMDIAPIDLLNIEVFAKRVASLAEYRKGLVEYLRSKMNSVAPNLATLIGDVVGARLISHAGSLTNLAKYPASTVQILGAEKALFRAIKTRSNTPKYGLIFHSSFIGKAAQANKGRISRYLANKCSLASRIDCFSETQTTVFGQKLRSQVEERLQFYESGDLPRKNVDVMIEAAQENAEAVKKIQKSEKKKKRKAKELNGSVVEVEDIEQPPKKKKKKNVDEVTAELDDSQVTENDTTITPKKKKKKNVEEVTAELDESQVAESDTTTTPKKKKKKKSKESKAAQED